jgi:cold shock CspA family protein
MSSSDTSASVRLTGRVKWFNNKTGFGFITIVGGDEQFKDASEIFAHHSAIKVSQEQYRYLVEGEYVEFSVSNTASGDHKFQAADVRGVKGGKLFCETRHEQRATASSSAGGSVGDRNARGGDRPVRGKQTTRGNSREGRSEWMLVRKDSSENRGGRGSGSGSGSGRGGRGGGRIYSTRPSGDRQSHSHSHSHSHPRESSMSESYVEHLQAKAAPAPAPAPAQTPTLTPASQTSEVSVTPKVVSARKPKQSKPSS